MTYRAIETAAPVSVDLSGQSAPMLDWLRIADLVLDDRYQRPLERANWALIKKIAQDFRWSRFAPVLVAPLEGGRFAIVDGQHRAHAAQLVGLERIPAQIVQMDLRMQADAFAWVNGHVRAVTKHALYKAALAAGEPWALAARDAVEAGGCRLMTSNAEGGRKKPGQVYCIGLIRRLVDQGCGSVVRVGLRAIRDSDMGEIGDAYCGPMLAIWFEVLASNQRFLRGDLTGFLNRYDLLAFRDRALEVRREPLHMGKSAKDIMVPALIEKLREHMGMAA